MTGHEDTTTASSGAGASSRKIVFLGTHGQYNIGDELLLETFLHQLGPEHRYVVNTYDTAFTRRQLAGRYDVELIDTAGDRRAFLGHLRDCDLLCFGGGSIIKELYSSTGRNRYATLLMILATVTFARLVARTPIVMLNVGVGPITTRRGRLLARMILGQVDLLTVRDERSHQTCLDVGLDADDVSLATDAVFSADADWLLQDRPSRPCPPPHVGTPVKVALNLNFDIENPDNWEYFLDRLASGLRAVNERHPIELHALPMQAGFKDHDDVSVLDEFATRLPEITMRRHRPTAPGHAARIISQCDVVVSERLHAIVMASIIGVPTLALAYDVKVTELASMLGLDATTVDINGPFSDREIVDGVSSLIEDHACHAARLRARSAERRTAARANFAAARDWMNHAVAR